jgi:hypothetical protein
VLVDDPVVDAFLAWPGIDARHIARGGVDIDARDLHLGVPPVERGGGGVELVERAHPVGIEGVADRVAAPLALDGGGGL